MIILSKISTKHQYVRLYVIKLFRRYIISNIIPTLINTNNKIKFTGRYPLITSPSTAIPERLPIKNICEISFHIFLYCFIVSIIITIKIPTMKSTATIARILIPHTSPPVYGKGLNNSVVTSMKNTNYIIEPQTDFIFAVAGEELGFIGTISIIILLLLIVIECILIARKAKDTSGKLICCGMGALIGFQAFINLCVATGLMPNTGMTLPFVSYGLTSLVSLYMGMGIVLNVGLQPKKYS